MIRRITKQELAQLLDLPPKARFWHQPAVKAARIGASINYDCDLIDALFAGCKHNFAQPLAVADLLNKKIILIRARSAKEQLTIGPSQRRRDYQSGKLHYIKLPGTCELRLTQATINVRSAKRVNRQSDKMTVAHIFGCATSAIRFLKLETVPGSYPLIFKPDSLHRCLLEHLPPWITPEEWIEERLSTTQPLLLFVEVAKLLGGRSRVAEAMQQELLRYVRIRVKHGFSPESVAEFIAYDEELSDAAICLLYDVGATAVRVWRKNGILTCRIQGHGPPHQLKQTCVLVMLRETLSRSASAKLWLDQQLAAKKSLYDVQTAKTHLGISEKNLNRLVQDNKISHIRLPNGRVKFSHSQLERYKAKHIAGR